MYFGTVHFPVISLENWEHGQENGEVLTSFSYIKQAATTTSHDVEPASAADMKKYASIASICMVLPQSLEDVRNSSDNIRAFDYACGYFAAMHHEVSHFYSYPGRMLVRKRLPPSLHPQKNLPHKIYQIQGKKNHSKDYFLWL